MSAPPALSHETLVESENQDRLEGHLAVERGGEGYAYSVGVYARFDKTE